MKLTTHLIVLLAIAALSACAAKGPVYESGITTARQALSSGDPRKAEAELDRILSIHKLEEGSKLEQLNFHKAYASVNLEMGYLEEPVFLRKNALDTATATQRAESTKKATKRYINARRALDNMKKLLPLAGKIEGRTKVDDNVDRYEIKLGKGITYLRIGILEGQSDYFERAQQFFDEAEKIANSTPVLAREPRLQFCKARREFQTGDRLIADQVIQVKRLLEGFHEQQSQTGFTFHLAYRDMLDFIWEYDTPRKLEAISGDGNDELQVREDLANQYLGWLAQYNESGVERPLVWEPFDRKIKLFFKSHQGWTERKESADRDQRRAAELTTDTDVPIESLVNLLDALATIEPEFRHENYNNYVRDARLSCIDSLLIDADNKMRLNSHDAARSAADKAMTYATALNPGDGERTALRKRCDNQTRSINSSEAFAKLDRDVRDVAQRQGADEALALLDTRAQDDALLAAAYATKVAALRTEISDNIDAYQDAGRILEMFAKTSDKSERLDLAKQLDQVVSTHKLTSFAADSKRAYRNALVENGQFAEAIEQTNAIASDGRDQTDDLAIGLCNFKTRDFSAAAKHFNNVQAKAIRNLKFVNDTEAGVYLRAAGEANLEAAKPEKSFAYLDELKDLQGDQRDPALDGLLLRCCKDRVGSGETLPLEEQRRWRTRWKELDSSAAGFDNLRELVGINYELGKTALSKKNEADALVHFKTAYEDLRTYFEDKGYGTLSDSDKVTADRLYACFADYAPLEPGKTYVYESKTLGRREEKRTGRKNDVAVTITGDGINDTQHWSKNSREDKLVRVIDQKDRRLLIRIPNPEQTAPEMNWLGQLIRITGIGQQFGKYDRCLTVRVYESGSVGSDYVEYTLAPDVGIVRQVFTANDIEYVLKSVN